MLVSTVNTPGSVTRSRPSIVTTRRPMVQAPTTKQTDINAPATTFEMAPAPTAGPKAGPVVDPPMLKPTKRATKTPTAIRTSTTVDHTPRPGLHAPVSSTDTFVRLRSCLVVRL